jgi:hypothetical protein
MEWNAVLSNLEPPVDFESGIDMIARMHFANHRLRLLDINAAKNDGSMKSLICV